MLLPVKAERPDFRAVLTGALAPTAFTAFSWSAVRWCRKKKKALIVKGLKSAPNETPKPGKHGHTPLRLDFLSRKQI